jgi:threonine/homoserine/homoserine lactone efflux protein
VTAVDYLYIALAVLGIGKLLEDQGRKRVLVFLSSAVLMIFGLLMIRKGINFLNIGTVAGEPVLTISESFISAFILTASSPLTIVFWSGVFTSKAIEYSLDKRGLIIFGISAGLATFLFLGFSVIILFVIKVMIPLLMIQVLNIFVGFVLIVYGVVRIRKAVKFI